jgi:hypothetical protein
MTAAAAKVKSQRMYVAINNATGKPIALVNAANVHQSYSHMARKTFTVRHASQQDVMNAVLAGVKPEDAGAEAAPEDEGE